MSAVLAETATPGRLRGFFSGARELDDSPVGVQGELPPWLRGTLLLGGPALWDLPSGPLHHWFDGYAMWHAVRLGATGVRYRSRFAQSRAWRHAQAAGRPGYGEFGTPAPANLLQRLIAPRISDNPAVVIARHGEHWISVSEVPLLTRFDPETLTTGDCVDLGRGGEPMHLMAAHGFTLDDGSYLNLGVQLGPRCVLKLFRLRPASVQPELIARIPTARAGYTHGFALAAGEAVIWETALRADALAFRFGAKAYADNFRWSPEGGSMLHAVALESGAVRSWRIPPMMAFHATQAWRDGSDLVLDLATYADGTIFDDLSLAHRRAGQPLRAQVRHQRYRLQDGRSEAEPQDLGHGIELQQVHPAAVGTRRAGVCWGAGSAPDGRFSDRTLRWDLDRDRLTQWQRPGATQLEPLFVPRPGGHADDDGVLLVPTLADHDPTTMIGVVDARSMQALAELAMPQVLPFGFHAAFRPA